MGRKALHASLPPKDPHHLHVLHEGKLGDPPHSVEELPGKDQSLVSVDQPGDALPETLSEFDEPPEPAGALESKPEIPGLVRRCGVDPIRQDPANCLRQPGVGVKEEDPGGLQGSGPFVHLPGSAPGRLQDPHPVCRRNLPGPVAGSAVRHHHPVGDGKVAQVPQEPGKALPLVQRRNDDAQEGRGLGRNPGQREATRGEVWTTGED
jgi:hypothetical protein